MRTPKQTVGHAPHLNPGGTTSHSTDETTQTIAKHSKAVQALVGKPAMPQAHSHATTGASLMLLNEAGKSLVIPRGNRSQANVKDISP